MLHRIGIILAALVGACLLAFGGLYLAGYRIYRIPTAAMEPTIEKDEMVVGCLSESYRDHVARFDIVIYRAPQASGEIYAKRVVGMPAEKIAIDKRGVFVGGKMLALPSAVSTDGLRLKRCSLVLPSDGVFVLGDLTSNSLDSRYLGPVPKKDVIGYLVFKK